MREIGHTLSLAHPFHASIMNPEFVFGSNVIRVQLKINYFTVMSYGFNSNNNGGMNESILQVVLL